MLRKLSMLAILGGSVGVPYAMFNGDQVTQLASGWFGSADEQYITAPTTSAEFTSNSQIYTQPDPSIYNPTASAPQTNQQFGAVAAGQLPTGNSQPIQPQPTLTGPVQVEMAEVLQMNITQQWVTSRWARVTTTLADTQYSGLRVAIVSGMQETDVTGSLTYYFDRNEVLQRITFHGTTGDPRLFTKLLTQQMEFEKDSTLGGELYTRSWLGRTTSVYRIRPAAVLHSGAKNSRYEILLELNRAQWRSNLSDTAQQLVK